MASITIPLYKPSLLGNERQYVNECLDTTWISSNGKFIAQFEASFSSISEAPYAVAVSNGTVALHLALHCLGIGPDDEVIVPSFTYIASVNAIAQTGAKPVFVDCTPDGWVLCPTEVRRRITPKTKAILVVHLYSAVCDMTEICAIGDEFGLYVVEDCAEALGATFEERHVGLHGHVGTFSFYGNKTITTGEGGMVVTTDPDLAARLRLVRGQGQSLDRRYWHTELGFNYRMTNICAAIGVAQLERWGEISVRKRAIAELYREKCRALPVTFQARDTRANTVDWLITCLLPEECDRDSIMARMLGRGIETRPTFYCSHHMPMYQSADVLPTSEDVSRRGLSLPSFPDLSDHEIAKVVEILQEEIEIAQRSSDGAQ